MIYLDHHPTDATGFVRPMPPAHRAGYDSHSYSKDRRPLPPPHAVNDEDERHNVAYHPVYAPVNGRHEHHSDMSPPHSLREVHVGHGHAYAPRGPSHPTDAGAHSGFSSWSEERDRRYEAERQYHEQHQQYQHHHHFRQQPYAQYELPVHPYAYGMPPAPYHVEAAEQGRMIFKDGRSAETHDLLHHRPPMSDDRHPLMAYGRHPSMHAGPMAAALPPPPPSPPSARRPSSTGVSDVVMHGASSGVSGASGDQRPTYVGYIKSAHDAILLLSACDLPSGGPQTFSANTYVPPPRRVTRRLLDAERADMVTSGCIFAWDEKEAGMKRWTDGRVWSASRVSGCFLTYRELEARKKSSNAASNMDGPTSNQYKPEGLIKQSFSVTTASGRKLHVISYFTKRDVREGRLRRVSEDPRFVGEGGGEWDLTVDEAEYSFPDGNHRNGTASSQQGGSDDMDAEQDESEASSDEEGDEGVVGGIDAGGARETDVRTLQHNPRKRSMPDDIDFDRAATSTTEQQKRRPPVRPTLQRLRSSSESDVPFSRSKLGRGGGGTSYNTSMQSLSSPSTAPTTSVSDAAAPLPEVSRKPLYTTLAGTRDRQRCPPAVAAATLTVISPTLPRESAIRGGACDMKPSESQDSASAVGALLSLAAHRAEPASGGVVADATKPVVPERRDSDRDALNMFSVRL